MQTGYELTYFGELQQLGMTTHLWKVSYVKGPDDSLVRLTLKDGKVAGFWVQ